MSAEKFAKLADVLALGASKAHEISDGMIADGRRVRAKELAQQIETIAKEFTSLAIALRRGQADGGNV